MDLSQTIDILHAKDLAGFKKLYFNPQKPVVIKGLADSTDAATKWSISFFKETMGDVMVELFDNNNKTSASSAFLKPDIHMRFSDYLDIIAQNEPSGLRMFLSDLFKQNPNLRKDFPCPHIFKGTLGRLGYMFFAARDTTVRLHYDIDLSNVLHTHFGGKKRVVLISPEYSNDLYRLPLNTYSLVDLDHPDFKEYPALQNVKGFTTVLHNGDSIFMPSGYWHYMTYLDSSFSVSYRKLAGSPRLVLKGMVNLLVYMPLDKMLNKLFGARWLNIKKGIAWKRAAGQDDSSYRTSSLSE